MKTQVMMPFERLAQVFATPAGVKRLMKRFGIGDTVYKWLRDYEGTGSGHQSPLDRVRDIIDEAQILDPSGASARLIASDPIEYLESIQDSNIKATSAWCNHSEANALLKEATDVITRLNSMDFDKMSEAQRRELYTEIIQLECKSHRVKALVFNSLKSNVQDFSQRAS